MLPGTRTHFVIPDTQAKPGVPTDHLAWIGQYLVDKFADTDTVVVHLGDHWDMPSLSSYDKGKKEMEGRRVQQDILAGNEAFRVLNQPLVELNRRRVVNKQKMWWPERHFLMGNHENRINVATSMDAQLDGLLSLDLLDTCNWTVHDFLVPLWLDGIAYAHYFYAPLTGRAYGSQGDLRLKTIGHSYTMGHQQTLMYNLRFVGGQSQHGLVAGACYCHDEDYKGPQGNAHWRGIVVCHEVDDGSYSPMFVSLDYLCRRYEGKRLEEFLLK